MLSRFARFGMRPVSVMAAQPQRFYLHELGLDANALVQMDADKVKKHEVDFWKVEKQDTKNALVLKDDDEIRQYVLSICKDYFRCTKKASLTLDSNLADHGLDSLDAIELVIRIEDELGYVIDGENLGKFKKPKHFFNFIKHMEAYKTEFKRLPHDGSKV